MKLSNVGRNALAIVALCTLLVSGGCGGEKVARVPVSGVVLIDGQPLKYGKISFYPVGGGSRPALAELNDKGEFDLGSEGVQRGPNRIAVMALEQLGDSGYQLHAPEKYSDAVTSGLEENIETPTDNLRIELTWGGDKPETIRTTDGAGPRS